MAGLYIESRLRPCYVCMNPIKRNNPCEIVEIEALFHMFLTDQKDALALIELEDGTVRTVHHSRIRFIDNKMREYCFNKGEKDDLQRKSED